MADFSFLSDSDNEKAAEELLSQAMDHSVLEQIAAINCSGFSDSVLPTQLETRFRKLKSLPVAMSTPKPCDVTRNSRSFGSSEFPKDPKIEKTEGNPVNEKRSHVNLDDEFVQSVENDFYSTIKKNPVGKKRLNSKSPSDSWSCSSESLSPPVKTGCFWCSPKKGCSNRKGKENKWGNKDEFLSDLSAFSSRNQEKLLKKAMEEEEKINREAEKIVKWAKQASARMDVSSIEDELSDD